MNANEIRGKRAGNSCLYRERVPRSFLRRNIDTILDAHELLLTGRVENPVYELMVANERRKAGWDFPTPEMLADLVKGDKPILIIGALQLRELKAHENNQWIGATTAASEDGLEWLPNARDVLRLPCALTATIFEVEGRRPIYIQTRPCTIVGRRSDDNGLYFNIVLESPFLIELNNLFAVVEAGSSGSRHWTRTMNAKHTLELVLQCNQSNDNAELLSLLESRDISHYHERPAKEGKLKITWSELPECPESGRLLPMQRTRGHKLLSMAYGVEIDMGWQRKKETPLQRYNRYHEAALGQFINSAFSRAAKSLQSKKLFVRYSLGEGDKACALVAEGLKCIWCDRSPVFASVMRLMHHYLTYHGHFAFHFDGKVEELEEEELISITISCESAKRNVSDLLSKEHNWVAPDKPFDLTRYVNGDESWVSCGKETFSRGTKGARARSVKPKETEPAPSPVQVLGKRKGAGEDVLDIPPCKRKKYVVPSIKGVTFYHSQSKLPMEAGEELSESEDEIYDTRLAQNQRRDLAEYNLPQGVCDFHLAFNQQMDAERPSSAILIKDGIVRFVRKYKWKLSDSLWFCELQKKLKHLQSKGVLCEDVVTYCLRLAQDSVDSTGPASTFGGLKDISMHNESNSNPEKYPKNIEPMHEDHEGETQREESHREIQNSDSVHEDIPPRLRSLRGRFVKHGEHSVAITPLPKSPLPQRQKKKPHRWSGAGTDKEIITNGHGKPFPNNSICNGQDHKWETQHRYNSTVANLSPLPSEDPSRAHHRYRWESGDFRPHPDISESSVRSKDTLSKGKYTERMVGSQNGNAPRNSQIEDDIWIQSVAHRHIICGRSDAPESTQKYSGYEFVMDEINEHTDKLRAEHLDFNKFIQRLNRDLNFDSSLDKLVCEDYHGDGTVFDEQTWLSVLKKWQSGRSKLVFEVRKDCDGTARDQRATNNVVNGTGGLQSQSRRQSQDNVKRGVCICGDRAEGGRGCIGCENMNCARAAFHLTCVGLTRRTAEWRCKDCNSVN